ncbi:hypothetical protein SBRCBS47491_006892 [Sporothrix bragantina]|uniref:LIM zinc-binding domain-containing protein n=1 Tax=Sporothrix bragantina TaxID=671064 RepID=A0ABP0C920_9PEZI
MDRPASFLPTIKCSSCGQEIEISMMGEHVCGGGAEEVAAPPPPAPANFDQFMSYGSKSNNSKSYNDNYSNNNYNDNNSFGYGSRDQDRSNRLPPKVDTSAANRSYYRAGQLTPVSNSSGSQSVSPKTPVGMMMGGMRTGGLGSSNNGASGRGNDRGGSSYSNNGGGNEYFEPKIAGEFDSPSQPRRPGGYGVMDDVVDAYPPPSTSPKRQQPNLLQRMNTIAPGPFDMNSSSAGSGGLGRKPTNARNAFPRQANNSDYSRENMEKANNTFPINNSSSSSNNNNNNGNDDDFQPPLFNRAGTFPRLNESAEPPSRTPSAPGPRPDRNRRQQDNMSNYNNDAYSSGNNNYNSPTYGGNPYSNGNSPPSDRTRRPSMGPDTSRAPPPRTSLLRPRTSGRDGSSSGSSNGSIPQINLAAEFGIGNPYHSASNSMSSTVSSVLSRPGIPFSSSQSSFSSASSFSTSSSTNSLNNINNAREQQRPKPSNNNNNNNNNMADFDSLMNDLQSMNTRDEPVPARRPSQDDRGRTGGYGGFGDSSNSIASSNSNKSYNSNNNSGYNSSNGSRTSPDRRPQSRGRNDMRGDMRDDMDRGYGVNLRREPSRARDPSLGRSNTRAAAQPPMPPMPPMPSRGNCKACGDLITGKSVSSADGRLTGRYHKACFVCTTCSEPFSSATFYVHDDKPYCESHYHAVNGSLCGTCNIGIEGPYLADEADTKHHPNCFVCGDCQQPLRDGYFEVSGGVYCERDALKRVQQMWLSQSMPTSAAPSTSSSRGGGMGNSLTVPRGLPSGPNVARRPSAGLPNSNAMGSAARPFGLPSGNRLAPRPRMEKRMTRLGMM